MTAGSAYAIVLDGYNGNFGKYQIDITAEQVRPIHTIFGLPAYLFTHLSVCLAVCLPRLLACSCFITQYVLVGQTFCEYTAEQAVAQYCRVLSMVLCHL